MSYALEKVLGHTPLTEALRTHVNGIPNQLPDTLFSVKERFLGDKGRFRELTGERRTAKRTHYGSPAIKRNLRDVGDRDVRMWHNFEEIEIDILMLQKLQSVDKYEQDMGKSWLADQLEQAAMRLQNNRVAAVTSVLRYGAIYWDSDGNLLPSSSGADTNLTVSFNVPANNQNQLNGIISASWALNNTDIPTQILSLKAQAAKDTGYQLTTAFYGKNIPSYLFKNDFMQSYLSRNTGFNDQYMRTAEIPDGLLGFKWIPVYEMFFEDNDGTNQSLWGDDLVVFTPDVMDEQYMKWWMPMEGSFQVPRSLSIPRDVSNILSNFETVHGIFSYAEMITNPPSAVGRYGDTFLPALRNPSVIYQADVTP